MSKISEMLSNLGVRRSILVLIGIGMAALSSWLPWMFRWTEYPVLIYIAMVAIRFALSALAIIDRTNPPVTDWVIVIGTLLSLVELGFANSQGWLTLVPSAQMVTTAGINGVPFLAVGVVSLYLGTGLYQNGKASKHTR